MDRMDKLPNNLQLTTYHLQLTWVVGACPPRINDFECVTYSLVMMMRSTITAFSFFEPGA